MLLDRLKAETRSHHERAERTRRMRMLTDEALTEEQYCETLAALHRVIEPLERRMLVSPPEFLARFSVVRRLKTPLLERDLRHFGRRWPASHSGSAQPFSDAEAIGVMYVLEGATLGGKFICGNLTRSLNIDPPAGASYFHSYGGERGAMWRAFRREVTGWHHDNRTQESAVLMAAIETFERFETALDERTDG